MKKIKVLLFTIILLLPFMVKAAAFGLSPTSYTLEPNKEFTIDVSVPQQIGSITFKATFDANKVEYVNKSNAVVDPTVNATNSTVTVVMSTTTGMSGRIITLHFKTKAGATSGTSQVIVSTDDCFDVTGDNEVVLTNALVTITHKVKSSDTSIKTFKVDGTTITYKDNVYSTSVSKEKVSVEVLAKDANATVVGGGTKTLACGNNSFKVTVTAENGTTKDYNANITRNCSSNTYLKSLSLSEGSISFNKDTKNYSVNLEGSISRIKITAAAEDSKSVVTGTGEKGLKYGDNNFVVEVKAEDGSTAKYVIVINRKDSRNDDNKLTSLVITDFNKPGEDPLLSVDTDELSNKTSYNLVVDNDVSSVNVKAVASDSKAKVSGNVGKISLKVGSNKISITVTAENETTNTYTIIVKRKASEGEEDDLDKDNTLSMITISGYNLDFSTDVEKYNLEIDEFIDHLDLDIIASSENSIVNVVGNENFKPGVNEVIIEVTSESGEVKKYIIEVKLPGGEDANVGIEDNSKDTNTTGSSSSKGNGLLIVCIILVLCGIGGLVFFLLKKKGKKDKPITNDKVEAASSLLSTNEVKPESNPLPEKETSSIVAQAAALEATKVSEEPKVEEPKVEEPKVEEPKVDPIPNVEDKPVPEVSVEPVKPEVSVEPVRPIEPVEPRVDTTNFADIAQSAVSQSIPDVRSISEVRNIPEPHDMPEEKLVSEVKSIQTKEDDLTATQLVSTIQGVSVENINIDEE